MKKKTLISKENVEHPIYNQHPWPLRRVENSKVCVETYFSSGKSMYIFMEDWERLCIEELGVIYVLVNSPKGLAPKTFKI